MDEFGVLVESIGFKSNKSTPLADLKSKNKINNGGSRSFVINSTFDAKPTSLNRPKSANISSSINGSFDVDLDGIFRSNTNRKTQNYDGFDDVFGGGSAKGSNPSGGNGFDFDSIFMGSNNSSVNSSVYDNDDIFGGMPGMKSSVASPANESPPIDDLLGNFDGMGLGSNGSRNNSGEMGKKVQEFDDLIPGFRGSSPSTNGANSSKSTPTSAKVPFAVPKPSPSGLFSALGEQDARENSVFSLVDELEEFAKGNVRNNANKRSDYFQTEKVEKTTHDLDSFFSMGPSNGSRNKSTSVDPVFDSLFQSRGAPGVEQNPSRSSSNTKKASSNSSNGKKATSATNIVDDFSFFFEAAPSSGEFQEIEGESEERRRARLNQHTRTQHRMAKALAEKNQRDFQTRQEQEEKHRIGETLDGDIKRWAVGKEGNLRALLSSLQYVLWPECGWQPVSLTDLITSVSVKKVYYKATLCVHPDKVQQKGATIEQKYIAEKVFDLLKEAWNKFNSEEL